MQIVGIEDTGRGPAHVHTIDIWFSERRQRWFVERLDEDGHQVGVAHRCDSEAEAQACLEEWLRQHSETRLVCPREASGAERHLLTQASRRAA